MRKKQIKNLLMILAIAVWILWLGAAAFQFQFAAKRLTTIRLHTDPSTVKIYLNGKQPFGRNYIKTPRDLTVPPGEHTLRLSREGYVPLKINIDATIGSVFEVDPTFEADPKATFGSLTVETAVDDEPLIVRINNGLIEGRAPLSGDDLILDRAHTIEVVKGDKTVSRCRFRFEEGTDAQAVTIRKTRGGNGPRI